MLRSLYRTLLRKKPSPSEAAEAIASLQGLPLKKQFTKVYEKNLFGGTESKSGPGSDLHQTALIRKKIPEILKSYNVKSLIDAPCGDWYWMKTMNLEGISYTGVDIVEKLIQKNQITYGKDQIAFLCQNLAKDPLPKADLILCRDCLVHLSFDDALRVLHNFKKSGSTYLLATTYDRDHCDLGAGFWRPIDMKRPPFSFQEPLEVINEGCTEANGLFSDKCLSLWRLDQISLKDFIP